MDDQRDLSKPGDLWEIYNSGQGNDHTGHYHCPTCGRSTRHELNRPCALNGDPVHDKLYGHLLFRCLECRTILYVFMFPGPNGQEAVLFSGVLGSLGTPNTPGEIKYYLEQAHRSASSGAYSAAIGMLRTGCDLLLGLNGFAGRMLGNKLQDLETKQLAGTAPVGFADMDPGAIKALKDLSNEALHPSTMPYADYNKFDGTIYHAAIIVVMYLLDEAYERPVKRRTAMSRLIQKTGPQNAPPAQPTP
jgi:hypothetical protein